MSSSLTSGEKRAHVFVILAWSFYFLHSFYKGKTVPRNAVEAGMCAYCLPALGQYFWSLLVLQLCI